VLVVAKSDDAHYALAEQFQQRNTEKHYAAIVVGVPDRDRDWIDAPIGPHPYHRERMAIRRDHPDAKPAKSFFEVRERFARFALLDVEIVTGRTHQIRLHMAHTGTPILCDRLYGGRSQITAQELRPEQASVPPSDWLLKRQALHAERLTIKHPVSGESMEFVAPWPSDLLHALHCLRGEG
jgi:23S rRNA pseudouridine1911/1915/1917 synthase